MAKLLKLRYLDASAGEKGVFTEVYFIEGEKYGMFRKLPRGSQETEDTSLKISDKENILEARTMGSEWKQVNKKTFMKHLNPLNNFREKKGWPPIVLPTPTEE